MLDLERSKAIGRVAILLPLLLLTNCDYQQPYAENGGAAGTGGTGGAGGGNASSSSTASSSTSSSSTSSSSSSGSSTEDCLNGVDDDGNKSIDCADLACSDVYQCAPNGPAGGIWSEPFQAALMAWADQAPPCVTNAAPKVYGLGPSPHQCTQCKCALAGAECAGGQLTCYDGANCSSSMATLQVTQPGCLPIGMGTYLSCKQTKPVIFNPTGAQCTVESGGDVSVPAPFNQKLLRCDVPSNAGEGCATGQHCAPKRAPEYTYLCIAASGQQMCPAGWTAPKLTGYGTWNDARECTACTCNTQAAICMQNAFTGHGDDACAGSASNLTTQNCVQAQNVQSINYKVQAPVLPPEACASHPQGQLNLDGMTTFCCR